MFSWKLVSFRSGAWIRVDAEEVVSFVILRGFVSEDIPTNDMSHDEELGTGRNHGESEEFLFGNESHRHFVQDTGINLSPPHHRSTIAF